MTAAEKRAEVTLREGRGRYQKDQAVTVEDMPGQDGGSEDVPPVPPVCVVTPPVQPDRDSTPEGIPESKQGARGDHCDLAEDANTHGHMTSPEDSAKDHPESQDNVSKDHSERQEEAPSDRHASFSDPSKLLTVNSSSKSERRGTASSVASEPETSPGPLPKEPSCPAEVRVQDSTYSWVVVTGAILHFILIGGMHKSFGLILAALAQQYNYSAAQVSIIPAFYMALSFFFAPVCGMFCRKYSARAVGTIGGLLSALGLCLSALSTDIGFLYVTNGILFGLGQSLCNFPTTLIVTQYFVKRRGLANALTSVGAAIGGVFFPLVVQAMLEEYGIQGTYLLIGGLQLNISVSAALYRPLPLQQRLAWLDILRARRRQKRSMANNPIKPTTNGEEIKLVLADTIVAKEAAIKKCSLTVPEVETNLRRRHSSGGSSTVVLPEDSQLHPKLGSHHRGSILGNSTAMLSQLSLTAVDDGADRPVQPSSGSCCWGRIAAALDLGLLKQPLYFVCVLGVFLYCSGLPHVCLLVPRFGLEIGVSRGQTANMISTIAPIDILSRLALGFLMDRNLFHKRYAFIICAWTGATGVLSLVFVHNYAGFYAASVFVFTSVGFFFVAMPLMYSEYYGIDRLSATLTLSNMVSGVANFVSQPLCGFLRDYAGSFRPVFGLLATLMYLSGASVLLHPCLFRRYPPEKRAAGDATAV